MEGLEVVVVGEEEEEEAVGAGEAMVMCGARAGGRKRGWVVSRSRVGTLE